MAASAISNLLRKNVGAGLARMTRAVVPVLLLFLLSTCYGRWSPNEDWDHFTNTFVVEIDGDSDVADLVAGTHGCFITSQIPMLGEVYIFEHQKMSRRSKRSAEDILERLLKDPNVKKVEQQKVLRREKRATLYDKQMELPIRHYDPSVYQRYNHDDDLMQSREFSERGVSPRINFIDPFYPDQWYLENRGQSGGPKGYDVNVVGVWAKGITGKGVVVTILDDGLDHTHPDLQQNYDAKASGNLNNRKDKKHDPMPDLQDTSNTHGTRCAGEVAATANNTVCGVGIAFNARIGGVRLLDGPVTDSLEAEALMYRNQYIDIYSASWGPTDDGKTLEGPGTYSSKALKAGAEKGRHGLGSLFIWATGNGGMYQDTCSCDGYVSSIYTLSIGCISDEGLSTYFSEICPSTMAVIFTGGSHHKPGAIDYRNPKIKVVTTDPIDGCTLEFQGTSSAAPLAAGCFALALEVNPHLTWRDMQHIVVQTARIPNTKERGWLQNGANWHVNPRFGFGVLDCGHMVEAAQNWTRVPEQHTCKVPADDTNVDIPSKGHITLKVTTDACQDDPDHAINHLEHVEVHIHLQHTYRGDVNMFLTSPDGMRSEILRVRPRDNSKKGIEFTFMTVFNWGERAAGEWMLEIADHPLNNTNRVNTGKLLEWSLILYGTDTAPPITETAMKQRSNRAGKAHSMDQVDLLHTIAEEEEESDGMKIAKGHENRKADSSHKDLLQKLLKIINEEETKDKERRREPVQAQSYDTFFKDADDEEPQRSVKREQRVEEADDMNVLLDEIDGWLKKRNNN